MRKRPFRLAASLPLAALVIALTACGTGNVGSANTALATTWSNNSWNNLDRLGNYSFQSSFSSGFPVGGQNVSFAFGGQYYDATDYQVEVTPGGGAFIAPTLDLLFNGDHSFLQTPAGWLDLGSPQSMANGLTLGFLDNAQGRWNRLVQTASDIHRTGSCQIAGRPGNAFRLRVAAIDSATNLTFAGSACQDVATGALLRLDVKGSLYSSQTGKVTVSDQFQITGVGNVPTIPAPTGASPVPEL